MDLPLPSRFLLWFSLLAIYQAEEGLPNAKVHHAALRTWTHLENIP